MRFAEARIKQKIEIENLIYGSDNSQQGSHPSSKIVNIMSLYTRVKVGNMGN
jgi:hypothetical protein